MSLLLSTSMTLFNTEQLNITNKFSSFVFLRRLTSVCIMLLLQINTQKPFTISVVGQIMWREYFYTMSVNNVHYNKMTENPICLNIPWYSDEEKLKKWENVRFCCVNIHASQAQFWKIILYLPLDNTVRPHCATPP